MADDRGVKESFEFYKYETMEGLKGSRNGRNNHQRTADRMKGLTEERCNSRGVI